MRATAIVATRMGPGQRTMAVPMRRQPRVRIGPAGFEQTEMAADDQQGRRQGQRRHHCDEDADSGGNAKALEIREPGEASDRTPRRQSSGPNPR